MGGKTMKTLLMVLSVISSITSCSGGKSEPSLAKSSLKSTASADSKTTVEPAPIPPPSVEEKKEEVGGDSQAEVQNTPADPAKADPVAAKAAELAAACKGAGVKTDRVTVFIPSNSGARCPYGMGDNLSKASAKIRARIESSYPSNIPKTRKLCSMTMDAGLFKMDYNDQIFLSLNKNVILSSSTEVGKLTSDATGFKQYNWELIKNGLSESNVKYCGPKVECQLPENTATGKFMFSISNEAGNSLFSSIVGSDISFGLVLTGDNDDTDCNLGQNLQLGIDYTYVE
jgi:hypothetical protein